MTSAARPDELDQRISAARAAAASGTPRSLLAFARLLRTGFRRDGRVELLIEARRAVDRAAAAVADSDELMVPVESTRAAVLNELAAVLNDPALADDAVTSARRMVGASAPDDPRWPSMAANLCIMLVGRYRQTGDDKALDEALARGREAVDRGRADDPHRVTHLTNYALALGLVAERDLDPAKVRAATAADRAALDLVPDDPQLLSNLQASLLREASATGIDGLLEEAREAGEKALLRTAPGDPRRPSRLTTLANLYQRLGGLEALTRAVDLADEAVRALPDAHRDRPAMLNNLAVKLRLRHAMDASRLDDLRAAVDLGRAAAAADHPDHVLFESNLGLALFDRYRITGASSLLSEAVAAQPDAVAQSPPGMVRGRYRSAAAAVLHALYRRSGRTEVLDQSVEQARGAVADLPVAHPLRARAWADLGVSLRSAYRETRDPRLLAEAVTALRQAVQDAQGTVEEALYLSNLAATMLPAAAGEFDDNPGPSLAWRADGQTEQFGHRSPHR